MKPETQTDRNINGNWPFRSSALSFPGREPRERTDHRENFRSRGTFVPWNIRSRGAKSPRTFAPLEHSLLRSECSKNFRSMSTLCSTNCSQSFPKMSDTSTNTNNFRAL